MRYIDQYCVVLCHQKKVLALVLAFACAFTMFAGAASFTDQADINTDNVEAVDLLTTLGIIKGYEDGSFNPEGTVTRAEMAKMIYTIRNGGNDDASAHIGNTTSFTDISGHWAEGYIKYLQNTGIVAGKSATRFDPDSQVTTTEAMKMALALAGYDEEHAGLTGINWATNTLTYATTYGLTDKVASAMTAGCARQDAAQILANCLDMTAVRWSAVVEDFVNDSKEGLSFSGEPISVGYKWMDLCTDIGVITDLDGSTIDLLIPDTDKPDSYDKDDNVQFTRIGTDYSALLGQRVKVLFNDGRHNDVIGVFALPDNEVITVYKNEIDAENARIKIDGTLYSLENDGVHAIIDGEEAAKNWNAVDFEDGNSPDIVTLIDSDDNGKIDNAVIKTVDVQKVTYVSSTQIIAGEQTYRFADETIDEDVARNDYVMITENLFNENKDIVVVDKQTGEVAATKGPNGAYTDYQFGENWYVAADDRSDINAAVRPGVNAEYVAVNNVLFYAARVTGSSSLEDVLFVALVGQDGLSRNQAAVMYPDGDTEIITLASRYTYDENGNEMTNPANPVTAGQFYEFNKSGNSYELSPVREYVPNQTVAVGGAFANEENEDYYGEYTYWGTENLNNSATVGDSITGTESPSYVNNVAAIDDDADVILYLPLNDTANNALNATGATAQDYEIKHITGKQLKSNNDKLNASNLEVQTLGTFSSDVNNLMRSTVIAVEYKLNRADWLEDTAGLISNANYGFIVSTPENVDGGIQFQMFTDDASEDSILVWADRSSAANFEKGAVIGYSSIEEEDGRNVITDAVKVDAKAGSISTVTPNGDTIVVRGAGEMDIDDFNTVIYTNSYNNTIIKDPDGMAVSSDEGRTNILYWEDSFAIIDSNEIVGQVYADEHSVTVPAVNSTSTLSSIQWTNDRTGETWSNGDRDYIYNNAVMELSITAREACTVTITVGGDVQGKPYDFAAGGNHVFDLFTVDGDVVVSTDVIQTSSTLTNPQNSAEVNNAFADYAIVTVQGNLPSGVNVPANRTLILDDATLAADTTIYGAGTVKMEGVTVMGSNDLTISGTLDVTNGMPNLDGTGTLTAGKVVAGNISAANLATVLTDYTNNAEVGNVTGTLAANLSGKTLVVSGNADLSGVTGSDADTDVTVTGRATIGDNWTILGSWKVGTFTGASTALTIGAAGSLEVTQSMNAADLDKITGQDTATLILGAASTGNYTGTTNLYGNHDGTGLVNTNPIPADTYVWTTNGIGGSSNGWIADA